MSLAKVLPVLKSVLKSKAFAVILSAFVVAIICMVCFWYYQSVCAYTMIQGFWHLTDNVYLLIDDRMISIIELKTDANYIVIDKNENIDFKYQSIFPLYKHTYELQFPKKGLNQNYLNALKSKKITFDLFPAAGVMQIIENDKIVANLTRDNQMSSQYM